MLNRAHVVAGALLLAASFCQPAARAADPVSETYCSALALDSISSAKKSMILPSMHVLAETEKPGPFVLPADVPSNTRSIICYRSSAVPAANDYKVVLAHIDLRIVAGASGQSQVGFLYFARGRIGFQMLGGSLTDAEKRELKDRLAALQEAAKLAIEHGSN